MEDGGVGAFTLFETLVYDLATNYRESGRREYDIYWDVVQGELLERLKSELHSAQATCLSRLKMTGLSQGLELSIERHFGQMGPTITHQVINSIKEFRLKSQFQSRKSQADRRANNIPDVAVMMWIPDQVKQEEEARSASARLEAMKEVVSELSGSQATVMRFDDPANISMEGITPSVEVWLRRTAIVIFDLTGERPNVFWEHGFTKCSGTDFIEVCSFDHFKNLPSHIMGKQIGTFTNLDDLRQYLRPKLQLLLTSHGLIP